MAVWNPKALVGERVTVVFAQSRDGAIAGQPYTGTCINNENGYFVQLDETSIGYAGCIWVYPDQQDTITPLEN